MAPPKAGGASGTIGEGAETPDSTKAGDTGSKEGTTASREREGLKDLKNIIIKHKQKSTEFEIYNCQCRCNPSKNPRRHSRKVNCPCRELGKDHEGQMGTKYGKGIPDRFPLDPLPNEETTPLALQCARKQPDNGRDQGPVDKRGGVPTLGASDPGRVLLQPVLSTQEGRWTEASDKPQSSERVRSTRALQDGRNPYLERYSKTRGLDGLSRSG